MKVNELMIGDLVNLDRIAPKKLCLGDIIEISRGMPAEPIRITEEILVTNGFKAPGCSIPNTEFYIRKNGDADVELEITEGRESFELMIVKNYRYLLTIYISFVHELQHALRLCGLNDLADNFKKQ